MSLRSQIEVKLRQSLSPTFLKVEDESSGHSVPTGTESHFFVTAVSKSFSGLSRVQRHQKVYQILAEEMQAGIHALALDLSTPEESPIGHESPECLGGSKVDR